MVFLNFYYNFDVYLGLEIPKYKYCIIDYLVSSTMTEFAFITYNVQS